MEVGFIGTGRMGKAMAANLLKAGHRVRAWDKATVPLRELERAGAEIAANAADAVRCDAIISMLPNDAALGVHRRRSAATCASCDGVRQHGNRLARLR